jgi:bifunctional pyridoxal-dependent enzyme with beta-cystathionase and maltose regulon repressor activities
MFTQPGDGVLIQTPCYDEFAKKTKETGDLAPVSPDTQAVAV